MGKGLTNWKVMLATLLVMIAVVEILGFLQPITSKFDMELLAIEGFGVDAMGSGEVAPLGSEVLCEDPGYHYCKGWKHCHKDYPDKCVTSWIASSDTKEDYRDGRIGDEAFIEECEVYVDGQLKVTDCFIDELYTRYKLWGESSGPPLTSQFLLSHPWAGEKPTCDENGCSGPGWSDVCSGASPCIGKTILLEDPYEWEGGVIPHPEAYLGMNSWNKISWDSHWSWTRRWQYNGVSYGYVVDCYLAKHCNTNEVCNRELDPTLPYDEWTCVNPCINITCDDYCENNKEYANGNCKLINQTAQCEYDVNECQYGCADTTCASAPPVGGGGGPSSFTGTTTVSAVEEPEFKPNFSILAILLLIMASGLYIWWGTEK